MGRTGSDTIVYMEETTRTHAAAEKAEGAILAESTFVLTEKTSPIRKITDSIPVTDEQIEDVAQVQSYLNGRLLYGIRQRLDSQCLVGDASGANLRGLKNVVGIQTQAKGADPVPDAFFKAMTKVRVTGRAMPTHHVMHPTDWQGVRLLRTADGVYIWGNPSEAGPERMWGLPVVQCEADSAGTGYVGSFMPAWVSLFERRGVDVQSAIRALVHGRQADHARGHAGGPRLLPSGSLCLGNRPEGRRQGRNGRPVTCGAALPEQTGRTTIMKDRKIAAEGDEPHLFRCSTRRRQ
ncbi:MAG: phage major capsid protein [Nitratireductor sp.]